MLTVRRVWRGGERTWSRLLTVAADPRLGDTGRPALVSGRRPIVASDGQTCRRCLMVIRVESIVHTRLGESIKLGIETLLKSRA